MSLTTTLPVLESYRDRERERVKGWGEKWVRKESHLHRVVMIFYASAAHAAREALYLCLVRSHLLSVPCQTGDISFDSQEYRMDFDEICGRSSLYHGYRLIDYILGESRTGTREQDTRENSNRRQSVLRQCQIGADA